MIKPDLLPTTYYLLPTTYYTTYYLINNTYTYDLSNP